MNRSLYLPGEDVFVIHPLFEDRHEDVEIEPGLLGDDVHGQLDQKLGGRSHVLVGVSDGHAHGRKDVVKQRKDVLSSNL